MIKPNLLGEVKVLLDAESNQTSFEGLILTKESK